MAKNATTNQISAAKEIVTKYFVITVNFFRDAFIFIGILATIALSLLNFAIVKWNLLKNYPTLSTLSTSYIGGLATAIIVTVATSILYKFYYEKKRKINYEETIDRVIYDMRVNFQLQNILDSGFKKTFENISDNLNEIHARASVANEIIIMSTYLEEPLFSLHNFTQFAKQNCKTLKVLLLDPDSKVVEARESKLKEKTLNLSMKNKIHSVFWQFKRIEELVNNVLVEDVIKLKKQNKKQISETQNNNIDEKDQEPKKFKIIAKTYDFYPPFFLLMCDDNYAVVGFFWHNARATAKTLFELEGNNSILIESLRDEFDEIFNNPSLSKEYSFEPKNYTFEK